jgi:hypothetical protein
MEKLTAVEWLVEQLRKQNTDSYISKIIDKAKQLEREQIINAANLPIKEQLNQNISHITSGRPLNKDEVNLVNKMVEVAFNNPAIPFVLVPIPITQLPTISKFYPCKLKWSLSEVNDEFLFENGKFFDDIKDVTNAIEYWYDKRNLINPNESITTPNT